MPKFRPWCGLLWGAVCSCPQVDGKRSVGGGFLSFTTARAVFVGERRGIIVGVGRVCVGNGIYSFIRCRKNELF